MDDQELGGREGWGRGEEYGEEAVGMGEDGVGVERRRWEDEGAGKGGDERKERQAEMAGRAKCL